MGDLEKQPELSSEPQSEVGSVTSLNDFHIKSPESQGVWGTFINGFKRADLSGIDTSKMSEAEIQAYLTSKAPLKRELHSWQISLIAIGGSIGSGLFLGSGSSFATGGPAGVVIGFAAIGFLLIFPTMQTLGELAVRYPVNGAFLQHVSRFVDPSWSLAMGWNYLMQWLVTFPLELISASITLEFWDSDDNGATNVSKAAWVALFYAVCVFMNMFGAKGYGWGESILSIIKVTAVIGFCIFAVCVTCGGYPGEYAHSNMDLSEFYTGITGKYIGGYFWHHPGAFVSGAKGVFSVLVNAAFSFSGTELSGLAAAETANPTRALPKAVKQVFWRVLLFYVVGLGLAGCLFPHDDSRLGASSDGSASPFVIAITNANVRALPSIMNVVIALAVLSVGNSCVYAASRTVASLAAQGYAPRFFAYIDREGRPLMGLMLVSVFGLLCFLAASDAHGTVFDWLLALSGLSSVFTWGSINLAHLRFRLAMRAQGRSLDEMAFTAIGGIFTSLLGFVIALAVICLQFWIALYPVGSDPDPEDFFKAYLSVPVVIVFYVGARILKRQKSWYVGLNEVDLDSGMRTEDLEALKQANIEYKEYAKSKNFLWRVYHFWC